MECCKAETDFPFDEMPFACDYDYLVQRFLVSSTTYGEYEPLLLFNGKYNDLRIQRAFAKCFTRGLDLSGCCAQNEYTSRYP
jgi:hypothetical protein